MVVVGNVVVGGCVTGVVLVVVIGGAAVGDGAAVVVVVELLSLIDSRPVNHRAQVLSSAAPERDTAPRNLQATAIAVALTGCGKPAQARRYSSDIRSCSSAFSSATPRVVSLQSSKTSRIALAMLSP